MLIDWFTVGAQVLNFVVLVGLLKRFLYRPVLAAIDAREALIARQLADAETTRAAALREQEYFRRRNEELDARRTALLKQATDDADAQRQRLVAAARESADAAASLRQEGERRDMERVRRSLADRTRDEVLAIARRVLGDLADATLEERIAAVFLRRLAALDPAAKAVLASGLDAGAPSATVRCAFEPDTALRETLRGAIAAALAPPATPVAVVFEVDHGLRGGIELVVGGRKTGWNVSSYLDAFERSLPPTTPAEAAK